MSSLEPDFWELDGGIFLSENFPGKCLKRWFGDHIHMIEPTIEFFRFCKSLADDIGIADEALLIPQVYEHGNDFLLMDYDPSAIPIVEKEPIRSNLKTLNLLMTKCKEIDSVNGSYLEAMIERKSKFIRESFETGKLVIGGLEIYE